MEPPLKLRFRRLGHLLAPARSGDSLFAPCRCAPLIEHSRARLDGDMPSGGAPNPTSRPTEIGYRLRHVLALPVAGSGLRPTQAPRQSAPARLGASVTRPCFCRPGPSPAALFLPRQGLGVFRHSRVIGKTLTNP